MTRFSYVLAIVSISASLLPCSVWWSYTDSQIMLDNLSMNKRLTNRWKMMLETVLVCLLWFYWCLKMVYSVSRPAGYPHSIRICQFEAKAVLMTMALLNWKWPHDGRIQRVYCTGRAQNTIICKVCSCGTVKIGDSARRLWKMLSTSQVTFLEVLWLNSTPAEFADLYA